MAKNYYEGLSADYPRPGLVSAGQSALLLKQAEDIIKLKEDVLPEISADYTPAQIEAENKAWPPVSGNVPVHLSTPSRPKHPRPSPKASARLVMGTSGHDR
jgi:hypothetical protein